MQNFFPAQYSTLSATALKDYLITKYRLDHSTTCRLLIRNVSDTYIVETLDRKYIFKIYRDAHRKRSEIEAEVELLNILRTSGNSVAYPIKDIEGKQVQQLNAIEGIRNGVLFSFAEGKVIVDLTDQHLIQLGHDMAKLHQTTSSIKLNNPRPLWNFETTLFEPLKDLKPHFSEMKEEYEYLYNISGKVVEKFKDFDTSKFSYGYCHYDFFPKNFHFDEQRKITFFDFDFAGEGYLINDLMSFFNHYFFHQFNNLISAEQAEKDFNVFLNAYQQQRPLTNDELQAIPYLGITFHIFFLKFFYDNYDDWSNVFLTPRYTKHRVALIKRWEEMYCKF
ncbi:Ser/Thr protein kinase RdoA involved in Cpx stress response, MazF antagonist [Chryseobacterium taichungense]|uniref:Ser/Thr protein kinase RdoA involved in Cpx stress response, MazF antagonist n=1 Tax=Chryseobacterium taichungense TaxID=295069 RepID=A0A1H7X5F0_9FLAO|nr:phosphotransferase [Chryseobacterium taichungense]SEM28329.1 Ser/Thr protein kinase RdoA involved in Cpx stress response, MazF antagonist [Chryseobacterium taichungense]